MAYCGCMKKDHHQYCTDCLSKEKANHVPPSRRPSYARMLAWIILFRASFLESVIQSHSQLIGYKKFGSLDDVSCYSKEF